MDTHTSNLMLNEAGAAAVKAKSSTRSELTAISIKNLPLPGTYLDSNVRRFGVRVSIGGTKTFIVQGRVRGEKHPTRLKVGRVGIMKLAAARERAIEILALMDAGKHPGDVLRDQRRERVARELAEETATRAAAENSFATVRAKFLQDYCGRNLRARTAYIYKSILGLAELKA